MADSKYGRIFTESDVKEIVQTAMENDFESEQDLVDFLDTDFIGRFGKDEPIFVIRAQDNFAVATVRAYSELCQGGHADAPEVVAGGLHQANVQKAVDDFLDWQTVNPDRVKIPD